MPSITNTTPRQPHTFGGVSISVPYPYEAGHTLSAAEAKQFNVWLATTVGNGFNRKLVALRDAANAERVGLHKAKTYTGPMDETGKKPAQITTADLDLDYQSAFDEAFSTYTPGVSNRGSGGATSTDPVMKHAQTLAKAKVTELITRKGLKVRDFQTSKTEAGDSKFSELVTSYIAANPWIVDSARAQLAALAEHEAEDFDLGVEEPA